MQDKNRVSRVVQSFLTNYRNRHIKVYDKYDKSKNTTPKDKNQDFAGKGELVPSLMPDGKFKLKPYNKNEK